MVLLLYALVLLLLNSCTISALESISQTQFLQYPQTLVSKNNTFRLGFFTLPNSPNNHYLGIWFSKVPVKTFVWVANRDKPITDTSGVVKVSQNGNLQLLNGQNQFIWSTNVSNSMSNPNSTAMILDSGNLILQHLNTTTWRSFDHPTDTLLPGMKPTVPIAAGQKNILFRAWKSPSDPSDQGSFVMGIGTIGIPQCFLWNNNGLPHWRSGPWDGNNFIGLENSQNSLADGFVLEENDDNGTLDILFSPVDQSILLNYVIDYRGTIIEQYWDDSRNNWTVGWESPSTECDFYGKCGAYGTCNHRNDPICRCLQGFEPKNDGEWKRGNWSSGCVRKTQLQCGNKGGQQDGFLTLHNMKVPDYIQKQTAFSQDTCKTQCLDNCSCLAYSYHLNIGCMTWTKDLIDIAEFSAGGIDLLVRLAASDLEEDNSRKVRVIIASTVIIGTILAAVLIYFIWRWMTGRGKRVKNEHKFGDNSMGLQEPPLYTFNMLRNVTNNFQETNKLGEGGFGPVYKGILEDGQIIAVKRLSRASGQGQEEFMNEVGVISKLQHRNLVKLLGCCVEGDERMLIYEYMHNKSLDVFLFDEERRKLLPWEKRRNIIEGICRGLLYLHRDSRLRIIHRDMKASNILLDEDLNPKISDFGMARIFGGDQDQANTRRVVGTYGYMSPEYAMGQFSEKSDVYSFGVILLEIVSGRKNTTFHRTEQSLTLLGHAWKLWNESQIVSFIDPTIVELEFEADIIRCIQVGLLCVQELAKDRPAMSTVISMLESDIEQLPYPKKPPFTDWDMSSDEQHSKTSSSNNYSVTIVQPR